jgi:hypothetical protein
VKPPRVCPQCGEPNRGGWKGFITASCPGDEELKCSNHIYVHCDRCGFHISDVSGPMKVTPKTGAVPVVVDWHGWDDAQIATIIAAAGGKS